MAESTLGADVKAVFGLSALLMVAASALDVGAIGYLVSPIVLAGFIYCVARAPLRYSYMTLAFCAFTLDNPFDKFAEGNYISPLNHVGAVLFDHLNNVTGIKALFFSGSDILLALMGVVGYMREKSGSRVDRAGRVPTPRPLVRLAQVSLLGSLYVWVWGMLHGGEFSWSLWQLQRVVYLPSLFLICHLGFRGPKDHVPLAKLLLGAATLRAVLAVLIKKLVVLKPDENGVVPGIAYATSHSDSILFAAASVLLILMVFERVGPKAFRLALMLLPILMLGMVANGRRLVWVHMALMLITLYLVTPDNRYKRRLRRGVYVLSPLVVVYMMAGWNNQWSGFYKPVRIARSVIEPSSDGSSLWRELENHNLIGTIQQSPIFGWGYGRRFIESVQLPAVAYSLEYYLPHNGLLGLWAFAGWIGFTAMTLLWGAAVFFAMRGYHASKLPSERVAAILSVGAVLVYFVQVFGDLGLGVLTGIYLLAPALATAGKLAVATGAWGGARQPAATPAAAFATDPGRGFGRADQRGNAGGRARSS